MLNTCKFTMEVRYIYQECVTLLVITSAVTVPCLEWYRAERGSSCWSPQFWSDTKNHDSTNCNNGTHRAEQTCAVFTSRNPWAETLSP